MNNEACAIVIILGVILIIPVGGIKKTPEN